MDEWIEKGEYIVADISLAIQLFRGKQSKILGSISGRLIKY